MEARRLAGQRRPQPIMGTKTLARIQMQRSREESRAIHELVKSKFAEVLKENQFRALKRHLRSEKKIAKYSPQHFLRDSCEQRMLGLTENEKELGNYSLRSLKSQSTLSEYNHKQTTRNDKEFIDNSLQRLNSEGEIPACLKRCSSEEQMRYLKSECNISNYHQRFSRNCISLEFLDDGLGDYKKHYSAELQPFANLVSLHKKYTMRCCLVIILL